MALSSALAEAGQISEAREASKTAVHLRRTYEWPSTGHRPIGRVVVLKGIGDGSFRELSPQEIDGLVAEEVLI